MADPTRNRPIQPASPDAAAPIAAFEISAIQYLDVAGRPRAALPSFTQDTATLLALYRAMQRVRAFDQRAIALQRTGQLSTYGSSLGQEAVAIAVGHAMRPEDVLLPTYREYAAQFLRGVMMSDILLYWGGDERGMAYAEGPRHDFPICIPVASHAPHAVGVAYAFRLRREARVAVCVLGDGGTSKGDFYEALNAAGAWQLPLVFVVNNNQWAISVPRRQQSACETLAQKAVAGGLPGVQVDGNDVIAVREVLGGAIERARRGEGPMLVEALTYRLGDHTTADDATRYRSAAEVQAAWEREPVKRLRAYLVSIGAWDESKEKALLAECAQEVEAGVQRYLATQPRAPQAMFEHLHATLPAAYTAQREELTRRGG